MTLHNLTPVKKIILQFNIWYDKLVLVKGVEEMKKEHYVLKKWVMNTIVMIQLLLFIILVCEFESIRLELLVKIPVMITLLFNHYMLENHTDLFMKGV